VVVLDCWSKYLISESDSNSKYEIRVVLPLTTLQYPSVIFPDKSVELKKSPTKCICLVTTSTDQALNIKFVLPFEDQKCINKGGVIR